MFLKNTLHSKLLKEFPRKSWNLEQVKSSAAAKELKTLVQLTGSRECQRENCAYCGEFNVVGDLKFSQNGAPQAYQLVIEISKNTGICRSSFG